MTTIETVDIVFDGPPESQGPRFVEIENKFGKSIGVGKWIHRSDGYWVLRLDVSLPVTEETF